MSIEQINRIVEIEKSKGKVVVMGCGCFEIFHIGHLEYLQEAKGYGDILIIGINSDEYIRKYKKREPKFNEEQRSRIISSIKYVDYVFVFEERTFDYSLRKLKPNYFVKGIDRLNVLEKETCEECSIKIEIVGEEKRSSSTDLLQYF